MGIPGDWVVILVRLNALERAIRARDWAEVEREYDRVRRAASKGAAAAKEVLNA